MAPTKSKKIAQETLALDTAEPEIEIEPVDEVLEKGPKTVTFLLDESDTHEEDIEYDDDGSGEEADDEEAHDDDEDDEEGHDDELVTAVAQLTQLLMTEDGEALGDVLHGIRESIEKQNKILYHAVKLFETKFATKRA